MVKIVTAKILGRETIKGIDVTGKLSRKASIDKTGDLIAEMCKLSENKDVEYLGAIDGAECVSYNGNRYYYLRWSGCSVQKDIGITEYTIEFSTNPTTPAN